MTRRLSQRAGLIALALFLGALIVLAGNVAIPIVLGEPIIGERTLGAIDAPDVAILHLIFSALPMFVLAMRGNKRLAMWIAAVVLMSGFWAYFVWQIWRDSLTGFAGGANIGLGLIMMASPFFVLLALKGLSLILRRQAK